MRKRAIAALFIASMLQLSPLQADDGRATLPRNSVGHVLVIGEGLESVARLYGISVRQLRESNPDLSWSEGETVVIPVQRHLWPTHTVRHGETLWRIAKAYSLTVEQLRQANGIGMADNTLLPGNVLLLPRAQKPLWSLPAVEPAPVSGAILLVGEERDTDPVDHGAVDSARRAAPGVAPSTAPTVTSSTAPTGARLSGTWVEVRLPDNRRAWAPVGELVIGSWQPQPPERVIAVGREFVGVPYKWGGVDPNGWDCSGFVQEVFRLGGHQVPRMADAQFQAFEKVTRDQLVPGDLVFFNTDGSGISHVGIYTGERRFLHASSSRGVVEDSLDDAYFSPRYVGAGRLPTWMETEDTTAQR